MNAVIADIQGAYAAALCENGSIRKIPNENYEIGQKIELPAAEKPAAPKKLRRMSRTVKSLGTIAAVFALVVCTVSGIAYATPYGTVSLDADASIEYTINCFNYVIDVKALNEDGDAVLESMDNSLLLNKKIDRAVSVTLEQNGCGENAGGETETVISVGTRGQGHSERLAGQLNDMMEHESAPAQVIPVTMDDVEAAHENDMTAGRKWMQDNVPPESRPDAGNGAAGNTAAADGTQSGENGNTGNTAAAPENSGRTAGQTAGQSGNAAAGGTGAAGQNGGNTQNVPAGTADSGTQNVQQTSETGTGSPNAAAAAAGSAEMAAGQR